MKLSISEKTILDSQTNEKLLLLTAISIIAWIYFSTLSVNHSEAEDSLYYLMDISRGSLGDQVHPNHLLYSLINYLFLNAWKLFGYEGSVGLPVHVINIIGALCTLLLVYFLATQLKFHLSIRYFCVFAVAFTCGFWWYSVEYEAYILPLVFMLLCFHRMVRIKTNFNKPANHIILGVFNAIAILFHQQQSLLGLVIFIGYFLIFYFDRPKIPWKIFLLKISLYIFVCFFVVLSTYCIVAIFIKDLTTFDQITNWGQGWFNKRPFKFGYWSVASIFLGLIGFSRTFIGGHFLFSFEWFSNFMQRNMPHFMLGEEIFLVRDFNLFKSISLSVFAFSIILLAIFIVIHIIKLKSLRLLTSNDNYSHQIRFFFILFVGYLLIYSLFNIYWEPQNVEHWIATVPVFVLTFGLLTNHIIHKVKIKISLVILIICLFYVNLLGSILPQTKQKNDYWYAFNSWLIQNCNSDDLLLSGSGIISDGYVKYHTRAKVISIFPDPDPRPIEKKFEEFIFYHKPKRILFSSTVYSPSKEYLQKFNLDHSTTKKFFEKAIKYLKMIHEDSWQKIYIYTKDR